MSKLVPFKAQTGEIIKVADVKVDKLNKYLEILPKLTSIDKVVLFGSVLEERCCTESDIDLLLFYNNRLQYRYDMSITLLDEFPDSCYDDTIRVPSEADLTGICGVIKEALLKGVVLYDRQVTRSTLLS